jgi:hypothetical protein
VHRLSWAAGAAGSEIRTGRTRGGQVLRSCVPTTMAGTQSAQGIFLSKNGLTKMATSGTAQTCPSTESGVLYYGNRATQDDGMISESDKLGLQMHRSHGIKRNESLSIQVQGHTLLTSQRQKCHAIGTWQDNQTEVNELGTNHSYNQQLTASSRKDGSVHPCSISSGVGSSSFSQPLDSAKLKNKAKSPPTCSHGRRKSRCKDCGGSSLCCHARLKVQCKECGFASRCAHGRRRSACKECGGSLYCCHGRQKSRCKECSGVAFCEHGRRRSHCRDCGGASMCEHGRRRSTCKACGGSSICGHGRQKSRCRECEEVCAELAAVLGRLQARGQRLQ